jgi:hypothetical protein
LWNFTGAYNPGLPYAVGDIATYEGQTWYRINANGGNVGDTPAEGAFWTLIAAEGAQGEPGTNGVTQIVAGTNVTIDPVGGVGVVTINASGGGGGGDLTAGPIRSSGGTSSINSQTGSGDTFVMSTGNPIFQSQILIQPGTIKIYAALVGIIVKLFVGNA